MDDVTIVIPTLDRVNNVERIIRNINDVTDNPMIIVVFTPGLCLEMEVLLKHLFTQYDNLEFMPSDQHKADIGDYAKKINKALQYTCTKWLFTGADDLRFHKNWFPNAMKIVTDSTQVIGTQDLGNPRVLAGDHATHFLIRTEYAKTTGTVSDQQSGRIFHPGYWHEFMDDELVAWSKKLNIWAFANDSVVEHLHPFWHKAPTDKTYEEFKKRMAYGKTIFDARQRRWTSA